MELFKFAYNWAQELWNHLTLQMGPSAMDPHKFAYTCALELWNYLNLFATGALSYGIIKIYIPMALEVWNHLNLITNVP